MHHPTDRTAHTTAFVTPVVENWLEREIAQWSLIGVEMCPTVHQMSIYIILCAGLFEE